MRIATRASRFQTPGANRAVAGLGFRVFGAGRAVTSIDAGSSKLLQEPQVGLVEEADVVDIVLEHRHPLDAESPGVSVPLGRVDASVAQHLRMHHAAAAHLEPSLVPAALAPHPAADPTRHVELEARLGEGEVARPNPDLAVFAVERLDHVEQGAFHVADGQTLVDRETLDLAEVRKARGLGCVAAVAPAWRDDVDRRLLDPLHGADLHGRRVRAQQELGAEVEGVPVLARGMPGGDVEGLEVVPLGLDLRPELDLVAEALQHRLDLAPHLGQDVDVAAAQRRTGERDVDGLCLGDVRQPRRLELGAACGQAGLDGPLGLVGRLAQRGSLGGLQLADARQETADLAALAAEVFDLDGLELGFGLGPAEGRQGALGQRGRIAHVASLRLISNRIRAAAAATLSDSTPSARGTVTSLRSLRDSPCASLPSTIIPADSIGVSDRGAPPAEAAPYPPRPSSSLHEVRATLSRKTLPAEARTALGE